MLKGLQALGGLTVLLFATFSNSNTYGLQNYSVGSGGTNSASSSTYKLNASTGDAAGTSSSATKALKASAIQAGQANVPAAPTLSDGGGTYYNQLGFTINQGGTDPTDYTYAVAVSTTAGFSSVGFVQSDGTLGANPIFRSYTAWGGSSGSIMTGLTANTTYYVRVGATQGAFSQSVYGPAASKATVGPQISMSLSPNVINLGDLLPGSIVSSGSGNLTLSFSTNAVSGGKVYIAGNNGGLRSTAVSNLIASLTGNLASSGQGFGVQAAVHAGASGSPTVVSPYDGAGNVVGGPSTTFGPLVSGSGTLSGTFDLTLLAKASTTTPAAGDYQELLTFVAAASF